MILNSVFLCGAVLAQQQASPKGQANTKSTPNEQAPPEEDTEAVPEVKEYSFNPLQAEKEVRIGNFYFKKGSYKAAASRFQEAVKWNPGSAEGYLRLGDAEEKLADQKAAREAYSKFLDLAPKDKRSEAVRKKLGKKG